MSKLKKMLSMVLAMVMVLAMRVFRHLQRMEKPKEMQQQEQHPIKEQLQ